MKHICKIFFVSALVFAFTFPSFAQDRFAPIEAKLKELAAKDVPGLNEKVDLSVNGTAIQDFIQAIAKTSNLNVSVDPSLNAKIYNNFSNVNVVDVFMFLCKKNDLDITFVGSIITFSPYNAPKPPVQAYVPKEIKITYDKNTQFITMDLKNDSLPQVVKELTRITEKNVVYAPELSNKLLNGFILNMPFAKAMEQLSFSNELKITSAEDNIYTIEKKDKEAQAKVNQSKSSTAPVQGLTIKQELNSHISIDAVNVPIADMVANVSKELGYNYFLFSEIKGNASLKLSNVSYDEFLGYIFNGSDYTFKKQADIYMLGDRNLEGLRVTKLVQLKYRTIDKITDFIPADLKKGVDIKIFPDLNGIILSGSLPRINEIEDFIRKIDQVVPVITIEIMIADVKKYHKVSTGIEAGVGKKAPGGTVFPELNYTLGSSTINDLISGINGFGIINLGNVTPNFYISLKAMEDEGIIKVRSTPQLATLNGHEAKMSVGSTQYYSETSTVLSGSLTGGSQTNTVWKSVTADLAITVNPIVSGDEQITLEINVTQSDFTAPQGVGAPPGNVKKDFKSLIRVKNGEMIILGGLEERRNENTGRGVPVLSRIPILKWFFSSRTKARSSDKLTVFIKPTVLY